MCNIKWHLKGTLKLLVRKCNTMLLTFVVKFYILLIKTQPSSPRLHPQKVEEPGPGGSVGWSTVPCTKKVRVWSLVRAGVGCNYSMFLPLPFLVSVSISLGEDFLKRRRRWTNHFLWEVAGWLVQWWQHHSLLVCFHATRAHHTIPFLLLPLFLLTCYNVTNRIGHNQIAKDSKV